MGGNNHTSVDATQLARCGTISMKAETDQAERVLTVSKRNQHLQLGQPGNNTYGNTDVAGTGNTVHLGNTYIYNVTESKSSSCHTTTLTPRPLGQRYGRQSLEQRQVTVTQKQQWLLFWFITVLSRTTEVRNASEVERTLQFMINILGRYLLCFQLLALSGRRSSLTLHVPKLRNVVSKDSPFFTACKLGDVDQIRYLMVNRLAHLSDIDEDGSCGLDFAISNGRYNVVQALLGYGADVEGSCSEDEFGSPLSLALWTGDEDIARLLLQHGACQLSVDNTHGWPPIFSLFLRSKANAHCVSLLRMLQCADDAAFKYSLMQANNYGRYVLHDLVFIGFHDNDALDIILQSGADPGARDPGGETAIAYAVTEGDLRCVRYLIDHHVGFDINSLDDEGYTLLHIAAHNGHDNIIRYFLSIGANWQATDKYPLTPADVARMVGGVKREQRFLQAVQDVCGIRWPRRSVKVVFGRHSRCNLWFAVTHRKIRRLTRRCCLLTRPFIYEYSVL